MRAAGALAAALLLTAAVGASAQDAQPPGAGDFSWGSGSTPWGPGASWAVPVASFAADPPYETGRPILLRSTSTHTGGAEHLVEFDWDLDGDGAYDDAHGASTTVTYDTPGEKVVGLRTRDDQNRSSESRAQLRVTPAGEADPDDDGAAPTASFTVKGTKRVGKTLTFTSTSPGPVATYAWDLDDDGAYDDGSTRQVKTKYPAPGERVVRLQITDPAGTAATAQRTLSIAPKKTKKPKKK